MASDRVLTHLGLIICQIFIQLFPRELGLNSNYYATLGNRTPNQTARKFSILKRLSLPDQTISVIMESGAVDLPLQKYSGALLDAEKSFIRYYRLTSNEISEIRKYTSSDYILFNSALRSKQVSVSAKHLLNGVAKLPRYIGTVFKGVSVSRYGELMKAPLGTKVTTNALWSTSLEKKVAEEWGNAEESIVLEIESISGREISLLSFLHSEMEVIIPPGTEMILVGKSGNSLRLVEAALQESGLSIQQKILSDKIESILAKVQPPSEQWRKKFLSYIDNDTSSLTSLQRESLVHLFSALHSKNLWKAYLQDLISLALLKAPIDLKTQRLTQGVFLNPLIERYLARGQKFHEITTKDLGEFWRSLKEGPFIDRAMHGDPEAHGVYTHLIQIDFATRFLHQKEIYDFDFFGFFSSQLGHKYWNLLFDSREPDLSQPEVMTTLLREIIELQ